MSGTNSAGLAGVAGGMPQMSGPMGLGGSGGMGLLGPNTQGVLKNFQGMSPEQLHELVSRMGPDSQYGQLANTVAQQKQVMSSAGGQAPGGWNGPMAGVQGPGANWRQPQQPPVPMPSVTIEGGGGGNAGQGGANSEADGSADAASGGDYEKGGGIKRIRRFDVGGVSPSEGMPTWTREAQRGQTSGLLTSDIGGRTDHIPANPIVGSYVIPADVVSGLGEGNTLAGARVLDAMMHSGPYGTSLPRPVGGGGRFSHLPAPPPRPAALTAQLANGQSRGGSTQDGTGTVPCLMAGGEYVVTPEDAARLGGGEVKKGHKVLDEFVKHVRHKTIRTMGTLKPPVGASRR
jgi:hypothetical protein